MKTDKNYKLYTFFAMLYTAILLISVLLDYKFISIGFVVASAATFIISITFFLGDIITEVYGYRLARQVVWSSIICLLIFSSLGYLLEKLPTPYYYKAYGQAYHGVLSLLFRAGVSNSIAISLGAFLNIFLLSKWKKLVKGKYFMWRSLGSSLVGEALYTFFVVTLVNFNMVTLPHFIEILFVSYVYKLLFDVVVIIPVGIIVRILKHVERIKATDFPDNVTPESSIVSSGN